MTVNYKIYTLFKLILYLLEKDEKYVASFLINNQSIVIQFLINQYIAFYSYFL